MRLQFLTFGTMSILKKKIDGIFNGLLVDVYGKRDSLAYETEPLFSKKINVVFGKDYIRITRLYHYGDDLYPSLDHIEGIAVILRHPDGSREILESLDFNSKDCRLHVVASLEAECEATVLQHIIISVEKVSQDL